MAVLGLRFCARAFSSCGKWGHSSSRCAGLSLPRPLLLRSTGSRRAGSVIVAHGPSCSAACGIFPDQGLNPCPLHWQADSQPLRHQGSPKHNFYIHGETKKSTWLILLRYSHYCGGLEPILQYLQGYIFCLLLLLQGLHWPVPTVTSATNWFNFSTNWWEINKAQNVLWYLEILWGLRWRSLRMSIARVEAMSLRFLDSGGLFKVCSGSEISSILWKPCGKISTPFPSLCCGGRGCGRWDGSWRPGRHGLATTPCITAWAICPSFYGIASVLLSP